MKLSHVSLTLCTILISSQSYARNLANQPEYQFSASEEKEEETQDANSHVPLTSEGPELIANDSQLADIEQVDVQDTATTQHLEGRVQEQASVQTDLKTINTKTASQGIVGQESFKFGKPLNLKMSPVRLDKIDFDGGAEIGIHKNLSVGLSIAGKGLGNYADQGNFSLSIREKNHEQNELVKTRYLSASLVSTVYVDGMNTNNFYFRFLLSYAALEGKLNKDVLNKNYEHYSIKNGSSFARIYGFSPSVCYQWLWKNGFNINLGFGPSIFKSESLKFEFTDHSESEAVTIKRRYGNDIFPYANVSLGLML